LQNKISIYDCNGDLVGKASYDVDSGRRKLDGVFRRIEQPEEEDELLSEEEDSKDQQGLKTNDV